MTNAWSLLYDEMSNEEEKIQSDQPIDQFTFDLIDKMYEEKQDLLDNPPTQSIFSEDRITLNTPSETTFEYKYNEDVILDELAEYVRGTYNQHYSVGTNRVQTLDLIEACGDGEAFCRSNILKYASRYDKKGTARRDIMKILHYAVLLMHFNDKNAQRETYPQ